jgi:hypothetical protein
VCVKVGVLHKGKNHTLVKYEKSGATELFPYVSEVNPNCQIFQFGLKSVDYGDDNNNETL